MGEQIDGFLAHFGSHGKELVGWFARKLRDGSSPPSERVSWSRLWPLSPSVACCKRGLPRVTSSNVAESGGRAGLRERRVETDQLSSSEYDLLVHDPRASFRLRIRFNPYRDECLTALRATLPFFYMLDRLIGLFQHDQRALGFGYRA